MRTPQALSYQSTSLTAPLTESDDLARWFLQQPRVGDMAYLLAFADDGVIWGRLVGETLSLAGQHFPNTSPPLRLLTLQQAHLFGTEGEIRLWRQDAGFAARRIFDQPDTQESAFDEGQILWGTQVVERKDGFTRLADGRQGLHHVPPLEIPALAFAPAPTLYRPLRLVVRHYLRHDADGRAAVALSRLVTLQLEPFPAVRGETR